MGPANNLASPISVIISSENSVSSVAQNGPYPMQLVVPMAVRKAVSAATITFTASSMIRCFFIISSFFSCALSICFSP